MKKYKWRWASVKGRGQGVGSVAGFGACLWLAVLLFGGTASLSQAEDVALRTGNACDGLGRDACCAQVLDTAVFKVTGDQPARGSRLVSKIACKAPRRALPKHSCRQLLVSRGVSAGEANRLCRPKGLAGRCRKNKACRVCSAELSAMGYGGAVASACYGATWVRKAAEAYPIVITK